MSLCQSDAPCHFVAVLKCPSVPKRRTVPKWHTVSFCRCAKVTLRAKVTHRAILIPTPFMYSFNFIVKLLIARPAKILFYCIWSISHIRPKSFNFLLSFIFFLNICLKYMQCWFTQHLIYRLKWIKRILNLINCCFLKSASWELCLIFLGNLASRGHI